MRHYLCARPFPTSCAVASLALGMIVLAASSLLVAVSGCTQRFAPS